MNQPREIEPRLASSGLLEAPGRRVIAAIGVDRYRHWPRLSNAVRDATGVVRLFRRLGFEEITEPLLDERATDRAIEELVTDGLRKLGPEDSLVLFYAGHGGTRKHRFDDREIKTGYLIPVDASSSPDKSITWIDLESWLRAVSLLPAKHILVILDACHSGIALDPVIKWRDAQTWQDTPLDALSARRSRRIITSALDDEVALDSGPIEGHSLFTGCLIEALTGGLPGDRDRRVTGSELGLYVQRRVKAYPGGQQTPDFGTFAFDDRGEMAISLAHDHAVPGEGAAPSRDPSPDPAPDDPAELRATRDPHDSTAAPEIDPAPRPRPIGLIVAGAIVALLGVAIGLVIARLDGRTAGGPPPPLQAEASLGRPPEAATASPPAQARAEVAARLDEVGRTLLFKSKYSEASAQFRAAVERVPAPRYLLNYCLALYHEGKFGEALAACQAVARRSPSADQSRKADQLMGQIRGEAMKQGIPLEENP